MRGGSFPVSSCYVYGFEFHFWVPYGIAKQLNIRQIFFEGYGSLSLEHGELLVEEVQNFFVGGYWQSGCLILFFFGNLLLICFSLPSC